MSPAASAAGPAAVASVERFFRGLLDGRLPDAAPAWRLRETEASGGPRPMLGWIEELLVRRSLGFLVRGGGWRRTGVVVGGQIVRARVYEEPVAGALALRFGPISLHAAILAARAAAGEAALDAAAIDRALDGLAPAGSGDALALHLISEALLDPRPRSAALERLGRRLRDASPLAWLLQAEPAPAPVAVADADGDGDDDAPPASSVDAETGEDLAAPSAPPDLAPLCAGGLAIATTYLEPELVARWHGRVEDALEHGAPDGIWRSLREVAVRLGALTQAALAARRPSLLLPALSLAQALLRPRGDLAPEHAPLAFVERVQARAASLLPTVSERERFCREAAELLRPAGLAGVEQERIRARPWLERTEEEKLYLTEAQREERNPFGDRPLADVAKAVERRLRGEVG